MFRSGRCTGFNTIALEGPFAVKTLRTEVEMAAAYRLRYEIFCKELCWLPQTDDMMESDDYDHAAIFFGVFEHDKLLAYLRVLLPDGGFMIENEFAGLVGTHRIRKERDTAEISRLCVAAEARNKRVYGCYTVSMLLFKGVYLWCIDNGVRYLYAVSEQKIYRLFSHRGLPFRPVNSHCLMPDGASAALVQLDWREFEQQSALKRPELLRWFTQNQLAPDEGLRQRPELGSLHPISS